MLERSAYYWHELIKLHNEPGFVFCGTLTGQTIGYRQLHYVGDLEMDPLKLLLIASTPGLMSIMVQPVKIGLISEQ